MKTLVSALLLLLLVSCGEYQIEHYKYSQITSGCMNHGPVVARNQLVFKYWDHPTNYFYGDRAPEPELHIGYSLTCGDGFSTVVVQ
jgi:hypothetical protein